VHILEGLATNGNVSIKALKRKGGEGAAGTGN